MSAVRTIRLTLRGQPISGIKVGIGETVHWVFTILDPETLEPMPLPSGLVNVSLVELKGGKPAYPAKISHQADVVDLDNGVWEDTWLDGETASSTEALLDPGAYGLDVSVTDEDGNRLQGLAFSIIELTPCASLPQAPVTPLPERDPLGLGPSGTAAVTRTGAAAIDAGALIKTSSTAGQFETLGAADDPSLLLGVAATACSGAGEEFSAQFFHGAGVNLLSDGTTTIGVAAALEPSTTVAGRVKAGTTNVIGYNTGAAVPSTLDAPVTARWFRAGGGGGSGAIEAYAFGDMPSAASNAGKLILDTTNGLLRRSDGNDWVVVTIGEDSVENVSGTEQSLLAAPITFVLASSGSTVQELNGPGGVDEITLVVAGDLTLVSNANPQCNIARTVRLQPYAAHRIVRISGVWYPEPVGAFDAADLPYDPDDTGNWPVVPDDTAEAADLLAARLRTIELTVPDAVADHETRLDALETMPAWTDATLINSWAPHLGGGATPGFSKDAFGCVRLRGWLRLGSPGTVAFQLPSGYRPASVLQFPTTTDSAQLGVVQIGTDGNVSIYNASGYSNAGTLTTLDSIQFLVTA